VTETVIIEAIIFPAIDVSIASLGIYLSTKKEKDVNRIRVRNKLLVKTIPNVPKISPKLRK